MVAFGAAAYAAKVFFTDPSFYAYGPYRGDSVAEIASDKPLYKGPDYCETCHAERYAQWSKSGHYRPEAGKVVMCETCHGPAGGRDKRGLFDHVASGVDHPASGKLPVPADTVKLCSLCHEKMPGRPAIQRQIEVNAHAGGQACTVCHNAHSPKIAVAAVSKSAKPGDVAAGKQKAARCAGCHGADGVSGNPAWPSLAGLQEAYLVNALKAYQTGARQDPMMAGLVKGLSDADIEQLAAYYAGLKCK